MGKIKLASIDLYHLGLGIEEFGREFSELLAVLQDLGLEVEYLDSRLEEDVLMDSSLLLVFAPARGAEFTEEDRELIKEYVEGGGGLLIAGHGRADESRSPSFISSLFGFRFSSDLVRDPGSFHLSEETPVTGQLARDHPAVDRSITKICLHAPSSISAEGCKVICYSEMTARSLGGQEGFLRLAVACENAGRVAGLGDYRMLSDEYITEYDNRVFAMSLLSWLARVRPRRGGGRGRVLLYPMEDSSFRGLGEEGYYRLAWDLYTRGFSVGYTMEVPSSMEADVLVAVDPPPPDELDKLAGFLESGGGVVLLVDRSHRVEHLNTFLQRAGIRVNKTPVRGGEYEGSLEHPVGRAALGAKLMTPLTMRVKPPAKEVLMWGVLGGFKCVAAAAEVGEGRLVVVGESWPFRNHSYWKGRRYELLRACVEWAAKKPTKAPPEELEGEALRRELERLRAMLEEATVERERLERELRALTGLDARVELLRRIRRAEEELKAAKSLASRVRVADRELLEAVLEACKRRVASAYRLFDYNPRAALEAALTAAEVARAIAEVLEARAPFEVKARA